MQTKAVITKESSVQTQTLLDTNLRRAWMIAGAISLGNGNGKARGRTNAEADDHEADRTGAANGSQCVHTQPFSDDNGVYRAVKLLKKQT